MTPKGARVFLVQYRLGGRSGRTRRFTLGKQGTLMADKARQRAKTLLGEVTSGTDIAERKTAQRDDLTISGLCELWLNEGCVHKKASTHATDRGNIERHITNPRRAGFQRDIAAGKTATNEKTEPRSRAYGTLNIIDEFTRECLAIRVKRKLNATDVIDALTYLFIIRGIPAYIRSDNGPAFIADAVRQWIKAVGSKAAYIEPGSP